MNKKILGLIMGVLGFVGQAHADINSANKAYDEKKYAQAVKLYQAEIGNPDHSQVQQSEISWRYGRALMAEGRDEGEVAYKYLKKAIKKYPNHAMIHLWFGNASGNMALQASIFSKLGYAKECRRAFAYAVRLDPQNIIARQSLLNFHLNAPSIAGGDNDIALIQAKAIMKLDEIKGYEAIIAVYSGMGEEKKALKFANEYVEKHPSSSKAYSVRANYFLNEKDYEEAYQDFVKSIAFAKAALTEGKDEDKKERLKQEAYNAIYMLGKTAVVGKIHRLEGINSFLELLKIDDFEIPLKKKYSQYRLAQLYVAEKMRKEAAHMISKALKGLDNKRLKRKLKKLKKKLRRIRKS